jgi:hypothetical protein
MKNLSYVIMAACLSSVAYQQAAQFFYVGDGSVKVSLRHSDPEVLQNMQTKNVPHGKAILTVEHSSGETLTRPINPSVRHNITFNAHTGKLTLDEDRVQPAASPTYSSGKK